jgi:hypothetical protein
MKRLLYLLPVILLALFEPLIVNATDTYTFRAS